MVNGNILLIEDGLNITNVKDSEKRAAVGNFCEMMEVANIEGDVLYYVYDDPCNIYSIRFNSNDPHCKLIGQRLLSQLQNVFGNYPHPLQNAEEFKTKSNPRTHGGYKYDNCPSSDYIYDKETIDLWHNHWYADNPDKIDWTNTNGIMPCYDRIITILRSELTKLKDNPDLICGLTHIETLYLASVDIELLNDAEVVSKFYSLIMDHKAEDGERIAYAKDIGAKICTANFYHEEPELKTLNKDKSQIVAIYSIKKEGKYQFLSIDKKHGRFEWCNENGNHICEIMFDSTIVENSTDASHSIEHIDDWKRIYHK